MKMGMSKTDRIIRTGIAFVLGIMIITGVISGIPAIILGILAVIFLLTSAAGYCSLYALLHISTCGTEKCKK